VLAPAPRAIAGAASNPADARRKSRRFKKHLPFALRRCF